MCGHTHFFLFFGSDEVLEGTVLLAVGRDRRVAGVKVEILQELVDELVQRFAAQSVYSEKKTVRS